MFQVLGILSKGAAAIFYSLISGIYSTVARIYDIMLDLVMHPNENFANIALADIIDTIYVIAGVFMLFRVMIAMIQMFLNPDQISDSSAGAGKLITRVVTAVVLLIALKPSGLILGDTGLLANIERAVLAEKGIITNIINAQPIVDTELSSPAIDTIESTLVEDVYAADKLVCYYLGVNSHTTKTEGSGAGTYTKHDLVINDVYKIEFYNTSNVEGKTGNLNCSGGTCKYSYSVKSNQNIYGKVENGKYSSLPGKITMGNVFDGDDFPTKCPKYLELTHKEGQTYYAAKKNHVSRNSIAGCYTKKVAGVSKSKIGDCQNIGIMGGYEKLKDVKEALSEVIADQEGTSAKQRYNFDSTNKWINSLSNFVNTEEASGNYTYLADVDTQAVAFAQTVGGTFIDCSGDEECDETKEDMFETSEANSAMVDYIDKDVATNDWFTGAIVGIALIVYLLILCIDVIVRRLKLIFMEMLSPIPVVAYVDPKDKMFNTWFKMYISTYADLFIKLIAMSLLVNLLKMDNLRALWGDGAGLLVKFFYIVAILVFAKLVPSMISKIFGLDANGGSFKDILGMAKGAAGFGAGAALGGAVGLATGGVGGLLRGAVGGAGAGLKGKPLEGAKAVATKNARINNAKANGLGFFDRSLAAMQGSVGYSAKGKLDNELKQSVDKKNMLDNFRKHKDNIENMADSSNYMSDLKTKVAMGKVSKEDMKANREQFIAANESVSDWMRTGKDGNIEVKNESGQWINTGEKKYTGNYKEAFETVDANGNKITGYRDKMFSYTDLTSGEKLQVTAKYEGAAEGKIGQAEREMRAEFNSNTFLQKELGMQGQSIDNFDAYKNAEATAKNKSNDYSAEIISKQSSDPYRKAQAREDYYKSSK